MGAIFPAPTSLSYIWVNNTESTNRPSLDSNIRLSSSILNINSIKMQISSVTVDWRLILITVYNRTVLKNGSCCTVRPGKVSCLQKFRHFWMIIRDIFFVSGSTEATKKKKNIAKVCHLYFWSNNTALFEHWNWKSSFKHRGWYVFTRRKGKHLIFLHLFFKLCQIYSHYLMK